MKTLPIDVCSPAFLDIEVGPLYGRYNFFSQKVGDQWRLVTYPGLELLTTVANNAGCRGAHSPPAAAAQGKCYSVNGNRVYAISGGVATAATGTLDTSTGDVELCSNKTHLVLVDGSFAYAMDFATQTITKITDVNCPGNPVTCAFLNSRFWICGVATVDTYYGSALNDPFTWTPAIFVTAEIAGDYIAGLVAGGDRMHVLGYNTYQPFYPGQGNNPLEAVNGGAIAIGATRGNYTWVYFLEALYFVSSDWGKSGCVFRLRGGVLEKISTPPIESYLRSVINRGFYAFCYSHDGQDFYEVCSAGTTSLGVSALYNISSNSWSLIDSYMGGYYDKHRVRAIVNTPAGNGRPLAFDFWNGKVYTLKSSWNKEDTTDVVRSTEFTIAAGIDKVFHNRLRIVLELQHDSLSSFTFVLGLAWSDDGGLTYNLGTTYEKEVTSGTTGQKITAIFSNLGSTENERTYVLFLISLPAYVVIRYADITLDKGGF